MLESGFDIEGMPVDMFYWLGKSSERKVDLKEFCSLCDQYYRKIIKHVNRRWLSLETAVTRALQLYQPFRSYFFLSQKGRPNHLERLEVYFQISSQKFSFFSTNMLYKVLLALKSTFRKRNHYYQDYMTRFNNSWKELPVSFSKLVLLEMKICLVVNEENKKIKNQAALIFDIFSHIFWRRIFSKRPIQPFR